METFDPFTAGLEESLAVARWAAAGGAAPAGRPLVVGGDSAAHLGVAA
jgi:hypothetical protein